MASCHRDDRRRPITGGAAGSVSPGCIREWGAAGRTHTEIARRLREDEGVASWWSQTVAVAYEQARGLRLPGQQAGGFTATASRTVGVPVERLFEAFAGAAPDAGLRLRTATAPRSSRWDFHDGSTRVNAGFEAVKQGRSRVALSHERLPDAAALERMKGYWRERLLALKTRLEEAS